MSKKELAFSVKAADCEWQYFRAGGKGGQNQNKTSSGVRVIHHASGARGESREERSQLQNRRAAFKRMTETTAFKVWVNRKLFQGELAEDWVKNEMKKSDHFLVENRDTGRWAPEVEKPKGEALSS